jgi:hypothetical protein
MAALSSDHVPNERSGVRRLAVVGAIVPVVFATAAAFHTDGDEEVIRALAGLVAVAAGCLGALSLAGALRVRPTRAGPVANVCFCLAVAAKEIGVAKASRIPGTPVVDGADRPVRRMISRELSFPARR